MLSYTNKKGKKVELTITRHAYVQFKERCSLVFGHTIDDREVAASFEKIFATNDRVVKLNRQEQWRQKKHGGEALYFRTNGLTFIVQNANIVTVEISDKGKRHLNKCKKLA